jgi:PH (Pleckstrin Homology) domain-containing protein
MYHVTVQQVPTRLVFRIPATAVLGALLFAITATPFAFAAPWLFVIYLVPIATIAWVLRLRTVADSEKLVARTLFARHELPWSDVRALRVSERSWVRAVVEDGKELPLPTVRTRHLPALALISGGRLDDPTETSESAESAEDPGPREDEPE